MYHRFHVYITLRKQMILFDSPYRCFHLWFGVNTTLYHPNISHPLENVSFLTYDSVQTIQHFSYQTILLRSTHHTLCPLD